MKNIYFNEYNLLMGSGGVQYLPLVSGILSAYIKTSEVVNKNFKVQPFIFCPDTSDAIVKLQKDPVISAFSISMWNEQLSLEVAREIKKNIQIVLSYLAGRNAPIVQANT